MNLEQITDHAHDPAADSGSGKRPLRRPVVFTAVLVPAAVGVGALSYPIITGLFA